MLGLLALLTLAESPLPTRAPLALAPAAVEQRLVAEERAFSRWRWAWTGIYGGFTVGNLVGSRLVDPAERIDYHVGAITSAIAILPLFLLPQPKAAPGTCAGGDQAGRVACLLELHARVAEYQRDCQRWPVHVINVAFNAAVSAYLALHPRHYAAAAINLVVGTAIGEVQIFTQPQGALLRW